MGELGFCTIGDIFYLSQTQLVRDITTDVGIQVWFVRLLHNKIFYTWLLSLKCYAQYFDVIQIMQHINVFLVPFIIYALLARPWRKFILTVQMLIPLFLILNPLKFTLDARIQFFQVYYFTLVGIGILKLILKKLLFAHR